MKTATLLVAVCCLAVSAADNKPIEVVTKAEPDWGMLTSGYLVEQRDVRLGVAENGQAFSISVVGGSVPEPVVRSLAQWRFKSGDFIIPLKVFVRVPLTASLERAQSPTWNLPAPLSDAIKRGADFDAARAAQLLASLPNAEEPDNPRASLLSYYAHKGSAYPEMAREARRDLIIWLIRTYPQDAILSTPFAIVNAVGEPLADSDAHTLIKQEWINALKQYPDDNAVAHNAVNFLRLTDPLLAVQIISSHHSLDQQANWLGSTAAYGALGVNAVDPGKGAALSAIGTAKAPLRQALLQSADLTIVLSGMATVSKLARSLSTHGALPTDFADYCASLLKHTRDLYPQTSLTCDATPLQTPGIQRVGGAVMEASILKKVQPVYPQKAKDRRIQGTVEFTATISEDGHIQELNLVRAPFALYDASRDAVLQWTYRPTTLGGIPVSVITDIIINFTLSQ